MKRLAAFLVLYLTLASLLPAASPLLTLENELLPSPASVGARAPQLVTVGSGRVLLSWIEPGSDNAPALYFAQLDPKTHAWGKPSVAGSTGANPTPTQRFGDPVTVSNGGRLASVWFVADKQDPRVLLSASPDGGLHFLMPQRIEDNHPIGTPDLVLLNDGTVFASWPERYNKDETALWLRRISPGGDLSVPVLLAVVPSDHAYPRLALLKDYDATSAQLLLAYTLGEGDAAQIVTRLLTVALPTTAAAKPCNCPTDDEVARGYALRGHVVSLIPSREALVMQHDEIPGVLPAAATEFRVDPAVLKLLATGNEIFARVELRGTEWWLFSARLIVSP